jgi:hypothetical protein
LRNLQIRNLQSAIRNPQSEIINTFFQVFGAIISYSVLESVLDLVRINIKKNKLKIICGLIWEIIHLHPLLSVELIEELKELVFRLREIG